MDADAERLDQEQLDVWRNRYREARMAGLEHLEACVFAADSSDIAQLRHLVRENCPPDLIARIVL